MKSKIIPPGICCKLSSALGLCLFFAWSVQAGTSTSAHYLVTNETLDGGGARMTSANYTSEGSFSYGNLTASVDYTDRGGYVAGLHNAPVVATNYTINLYTNSTFKVAVGSVATSPDGDQIIYWVVQNPSAENGAVVNDSAWLFYTPPLNYVGNDSFAFTVVDAEGDSASGTVLAEITTAPVTPSQPTLNLIGMTSIPESTAMTLRFGGLPGATYQVEYTDNLLRPVTWIPLGSATVTNGVLTIVDPTAGVASQRFYRTLYQSQ